MRKRICRVKDGLGGYTRKDIKICKHTYDEHERIILNMVREKYLYFKYIKVKKQSENK